MKQETRNKFLLISLVVLSAALGLTLFLKSAQKGGTVDPDTYRQVDLKKIDRVLMESTKGKVALEYNNNSWKVNNGVTADRNLVEVLFATLKQAEPKRPVATSMQDSIRNVLSSQGVKV